MRQLALVLVTAGLFAPSARADLVTNVAPANGETVLSDQPITFAWSSTLGNSPVFGGWVNLVVSSSTGTVVDAMYRCEPGDTQTCPKSTTAGPFTPGAYSWYVRWWVWYEDRPAEWIPSSPTSFTAVEAQPRDPPPKNEPPRARFTHNPPAPTVGQAVSFDASTSTDDGAIASYSWSFGDGGTAGGGQASHVYALPGTYTATLVVEDDKGAKGETSATVTVTPLPNVLPTARFTFLPVAPTAGQSASFDATGSADADGRIVAYAWTFGDGASAIGATAQHTYTAPGSYVVTLVVTDDRGATASATAPVTVVAAQPPPDTTPPAASALASSGRTRSSVRLWFRPTDDSGLVRVVATVRRRGRTIATLRSSFVRADGSRAYLSWRAPRTPETLRFCVRPQDPAGNTGAESCARVLVRR
jgi:PKD repeat protein